MVVILAPQEYHGGFYSCYNTASAVNYAWSSWLRFALMNSKSSASSRLVAEASLPIERLLCTYFCNTLHLVRETKISNVFGDHNQAIQTKASEVMMQ